MATEAYCKRMIEVMKKGILPATGCTEPISVAFTAAVAAKHLDYPVERIEVRVSANLMKNGMGVTVPGTGKPGLYIAAAIGAIDGDPEGGLQVISHVHEGKSEEAAKMVSDGLVTVTVKTVPNPLYVEVVLFAQGHEAEARVIDSHTNLIYIRKDDKVLFEVPQDGAGSVDADTEFLQGTTLKQVLDFATTAPIDDIRFMKEAYDLNWKLVEVGMSGQYGLGYGKALHDQIESGLVGDDMCNEVIYSTAAGADARMGGAPYPAMSNSGSGDQGICATVPVCVVARRLKVDEETLIRALTLSHAVALYIHSFLPKLSALCCSLTACMGSAAGMGWLLSKDYDVIARALSSMTGDVTGMVCDGAANSCAMKASSSAGSAFRSVVLAMAGHRVMGNEGLVADDVDESLRNIGELARGGMQETDRKILDIMIHKNQ